MTTNGTKNGAWIVPFKWLNTILLSIIGFFLVMMLQKADRLITDYLETKSDVRLLDLKVTRIEFRQSADIKELKDGIRALDEEINKIQRQSR